MKLAAVVFCTMVVFPAHVCAQAREYLEFRDSLSRLTDVAALYRLQSQRPMAATTGQAGGVIERGLIGLRIYELTGDEDDASRARDVFRQASERFPDVAWTHYGLALSLANGPEIRPGGVLSGVTLGQSIAEILGRDPRSQAKRSLRRALEADPAFVPAATMLADMAVKDGRDLEALAEARAALERTRQARGGVTPEIARAVASVETARGNYAEAAHATEAAVSANADDAGALLAHSVALMLQPGRERAGGSAYFRGVEHLDRESAERYYADVAGIVTTAEAADWRVAKLDARREWIRRFWGRRAADGGVQPAERVAEHYRRLAEAQAKYLRNSRRGVDGGGMIISDETAPGNPFDDRGVVLLRRGRPTTMVRSTGRGILPNETWVYGDVDGGNLLFHFVALRGGRDHSLVSDLFQALDIGTALSVDDRERAVLTLIEDRAPYEPRYQATAGRLRVLIQDGASLTDTDVRVITETVDAEYRRGVRKTLDADTYTASFTRRLAYFYDLFTFRSPQGRTELTASFAIPGAALAAVEQGGGYVYPLRISVILIDTLQGSVSRTDTVLRLPSARMLQGGEYLRTHLTMPVAPSGNTVHRVVVENPLIDAGNLYGGGSRLRDYGGAGVKVSDIVLASPDSTGDWERGGARLALTLPRRFQPGRPFTLFYEVYDLAPDARYRTRLTVEPVDRGGAWSRLKGLFGMGPPSVDLRFEDDAHPDADGVVQELRKLGTDLPPGRYRMRVSVTDEGGRRTASSETLFEVIP